MKTTEQPASFVAIAEAAACWGSGEADTHYRAGDRGEEEKTRIAGPGPSQSVCVYNTCIIMDDLFVIPYTV